MSDETLYVSWDWLTRGSSIDPSKVIKLDILETALGTYLCITYLKGDVNGI